MQSRKHEFSWTVSFLPLSRSASLTLVMDWLLLTCSPPCIRFFLFHLCSYGPRFLGTPHDCRWKFYWSAKATNILENRSRYTISHERTASSIHFLSLRWFFWRLRHILQSSSTRFSLKTCPVSPPIHSRFAT